jgi:hypothetical protein
MSDVFLHLIPTDPEFVPSITAQEALLECLRKALPGSDSFECQTMSETTFIDPGENLEKICCPLCGEELDQEWWSSSMNKASEKQFLNLAVQMPCCRGSTTLNDLSYKMAAGFARFLIEVSNPTVLKLQKKTKNALKNLMGRPIRTIWARY